MIIHQEKKYPFDFSVITAVYNSAPFLMQTLDSFIAQTVGFERIQVILVDDGSDDGSAQMCDSFAAAHPDNVIAVHNAHAGVSHARNTGLALAQGRYINFCDSDDYFTPGAFESALRFFEKHGHETNVVSFPLYKFEGDSGEHPLNEGKFTRGNRVIDLTQEPVVQMHISSSFIKAEAFEGKQYDEKLAYAGDAHMISYILLDHPYLGVITDEKYMYRIRSAGQASIIQTAGKKPAWYLDVLEHFHMQIAQECKKKCGEIPNFIQAMLAHDLQWRIRMKALPDDILPKEEALYYRSELLSVYKDIDESWIWAQKSMAHDRKCCVLAHKYGMRTGEPFTARSEEEQKRLLAWQKGYGVQLDFLRMDGTTLIVDGTIRLLPYGFEHIEVFADTGTGRTVGALREGGKPVLTLGMETVRERHFTLRIPLDGCRKTHICLGYKVEGELMSTKVSRVGDFFALSTKYGQSYCILGGYVIMRNHGGLSVRKKKPLEKVWRELRLLIEIGRKKLPEDCGAVRMRLAYHLHKLFKSRPLWLFSDRYTRAGDNAEALFAYVKKNGSKKIRSVYLLTRDSEDYARMAKTGRVEQPLSDRHKLLHLLCDYNISSAAGKKTLFPFENSGEAMRDILAQKRYVFLQHGVTQNDVSGWLGRYYANAFGFVTVSQAERDAVLGDAYCYEPGQVWLTGFPRYDRLYHAEENCIALMPTWRRYLTDGADQMGVRGLARGFEQSEYYRFYQGLLNDERLKAALERWDYKLLVMMHPNLIRYKDRFAGHERVEFLDESAAYRDIFARSRLLVTDYSSVVFDFAYLHKPVIYAQFDAEHFFGGSHHCRSGYHNCRRDGFGEVETTLEGTVDRIIGYLENGCALKEQYRERIDAFFAYKDQENCRRVYERLMESPKM